MQVNSNKIEYLVGNEAIMREAPYVPVRGVFSELVIDFLAELSKSILSDVSIREYKDVVGFGYWIRKSAIKNYIKNISRIENKIGRGVCFHVAPSNIPVQFVVSLVPAILAGNCNIIRCSSKYFEQTDIICSKINYLLENGYGELKPYICIIRYKHDEEITKWFCSVCDVRIIWGGDRTVSYIKKFTTQPRTIEVSFSDRYSIAVMDSDEVVNSDINTLIKDFWTDTYYVDQNACSSPRLIVWVGRQIDTARSLFWSVLEKKAKMEYNLAPIQAVNKLTAFSRLAMKFQNINLVSNSNYVFRVEVKTLSDDIMEYKESGGYFFEYIGNTIDDIVPLLRNKACQTIGVYGITTERIKDLVYREGVKGVDRIVKIGKTTAPGLDWDGYSLIDTMSRYVEVG